MISLHIEVPAAQFFFYINKYIIRNREYAPVLVLSAPVAATLSLALCSAPHSHSLRFTHAVATPDLFPAFSRDLNSPELTRRYFTIV